MWWLPIPEKLNNSIFPRGEPSESEGTAEEEFCLSAQQGQSLLEMVLALAVMVLVVTALVKLTTNAVRNADFAKSKVLATKYAQESLDEARLSRDQNRVTFFVDGSCDQSDIVGSFARIRECALNGSTMTVIATVSWSSGGRSHQSQLQTELTNWR